MDDAPAVSVYGAIGTERAVDTGAWRGWIRIGGLSCVKVTRRALMPAWIRLTSRLLVVAVTADMGAFRHQFVARA
jgi:hypothetical protein